ncbi:hypothetical protein ACX80N_12685 [Arthrobacter sp. MDT2-16]
MHWSDGELHGRECREEEADDGQDAGEEGTHEALNGLVTNVGTPGITAI